MGRPFTLPNGEQLLAPMAANSSEASWCTPTVPVPSEAVSVKSVPPPRSVNSTTVAATQHQYASASERWTRDGRAEHASIASFGRFSLQVCGLWVFVLAVEANIL